MEHHMLYEPYVEPAAASQATPFHRRWADSADTILGRVIEIPAALLVVAEIIVLLAGVTSRYVLHSPLVWSDELVASTCG